MSNFLRNFHIFGHIFLAVSIFLFWPTKARETNVWQFLIRSNFQIMNIWSCLSIISFYFHPLDVVHPVALAHIPSVTDPLSNALSEKPRASVQIYTYRHAHTARHGTCFLPLESHSFSHFQERNWSFEYEKEGKIPESIWGASAHLFEALTIPPLSSLVSVMK